MQQVPETHRGEAQPERHFLGRDTNVFMLRAGCSAGPREWWTKGQKRCPEPRGRICVPSPLCCAWLPLPLSASALFSPLLALLAFLLVHWSCFQKVPSALIPCHCASATLTSWPSPRLQSPKRRPLLAIQGAALRLLESSVQGETRWVWAKPNSPIPETGAVLAEGLRSAEASPKASFIPTPKTELCPLLPLKDIFWLKGHISHASPRPGYRDICAYTSPWCYSQPKAHTSFPSLSIKLHPGNYNFTELEIIRSRVYFSSQSFPHTLNSMFRLMYLVEKII